MWAKLKCEGAPLAGPGARPHDGRELPARAAAVAWRLQHLRDAPAVGDLLAVALFLVVLVALPAIRKKREETFVEEE